MPEPERASPAGTGRGPLVQPIAQPRLGSWALEMYWTCVFIVGRPTPSSWSILASVRHVASNARTFVSQGVSRIVLRDGFVRDALRRSIMSVSTLRRWWPMPPRPKWLISTSRQPFKPWMSAGRGRPDPSGSSGRSRDPAFIRANGFRRAGPLGSHPRRRWPARTTSLMRHQAPRRWKGFALRGPRDRRLACSAAPSMGALGGALSRLSIPIGSREPNFLSTPALIPNGCQRTSHARQRLQRSGIHRTVEGPRPALPSGPRRAAFKVKRTRRGRRGRAYRRESRSPRAPNTPANLGRSPGGTRGRARPRSP